MTAKMCNKCHESKPLDQFRKWRGSCKACDAAAQRARYAADPEAWRQRSADYREANRELINKYAAERLVANRDVINERKRAAYARDLEASRAAARAKYAANSDRYRGYASNRRALKLGALFGEVNVTDLRNAFPDCYLCGQVVADNWHLDHVVPLTRGGAHSVMNLRPVCADCNWRKADWLLTELTGYSGPTLVGAWTVRPVSCQG